MSLDISRLFEVDKKVEISLEVVRTALTVGLLIKPVDVAVELRADVVLQAESEAVVLLFHTVSAWPRQVLNFPD